MKKLSLLLLMIITLSGVALAVESDYSDVVQVVVPPDPPVITVADIYKDQLYLEWLGEADYFIPLLNGSSYTSTVNNSTYITLQTSGDYEVRVKAVNAGGEAISEAVYMTVLLPPKNLKGTVDNNSVNLSWDADPFAEGYRVERSQDGKNYVLVAITSNNQFRNENLQYEQTYYYRVRSYKGTIISEASDPITVTTPKPNLPAKPILTYDVTKDYKVKFSWNYDKYVEEYELNINGAVYTLPASVQTYEYQAHEGDNLTVYLVAKNKYGQTQSDIINIQINKMLIEKAQAKQVLTYTGYTIAGLGSIFALGFALKALLVLVGFI